MCCIFYVVRKKHVSIFVGTLIVKTLEYGVLKTHMQCIETLCIRQRLVFGSQCLENELWHNCFSKSHLLRKIITIFDSI